MELNFTKMHGAGNDFVMIENLDGRIELSRQQVAAMCDRRFGIGADGLILLNPPGKPELDATMIYYNADGGRVEMCGNGARCFTAFALAHNVGSDSRVSFQTDAGAMTALADGSDFTIRMTPPHSVKLDQSLEADGRSYSYHFLNTGVPHVVVFTEDVEAVDIRPEGRAIRMHQNFQPSGTNANFAQIQPDGIIKVRTYERGVEDETLACGTGVAAVAIAACLTQGQQKPVSVLVKGRDTLRVDFVSNEDGISDVTLTGPAKFVYEGRIDLADLPAASG